jgi:hypothetical protein
MSLNWHYIKNITKKPRIMYPANLIGTNKELAEFTNKTEELKGGAVVGRSWKASELRLKSNEGKYRNLTKFTNKF